MSSQPATSDNRLNRSRKFNAEELQLKLLWLIQDKPVHGYRLIKRLAELSADYYSPSPGMVYPALTRLETLGLTKVELQGKRKNYRITPAGLQYLEQRSQQTEQLLTALRHGARQMQWLALAEENPAEASARTGWLPEYVQARRDLRSTLLASSDSDHETQRQITRLIQQTNAEILKLLGQMSRDKPLDEHLKHA